MLNHLVAQGLPLLGAAVIPAYRYLGEARQATLEYYNATRTRTKTATFVLGLFAAAVSCVVLNQGVSREELFESYDVKLWSFNDHLVLFALATIPSVAILAILYAGFRVIETIRSAFSF